MDNTLAWENYWREHSSSGCVPNSRGVASALSTCWRDFARKLPINATVLDLGSGAGAVLDCLGSSRPDLNAIGVDSAPSIPRDAKFGSVLVDTCMEYLPFDDRSFDAVSSQFGIEYSHLPRAISEVSRIAKEGTLVRFVIHDNNGPIVAQASSRRDALQWAFEESGYFPIAERIIAAGAISPLSTLPALNQAPDIARKVHPREPVAWKIIMALLQLVRDREMLAIAERRQRLRHLREQVESEITTLTALLRSAKDERGIAELTGLLAAYNAASEKPSKVVDPESRRAFAWLVDASFR